MGLGLSSDFSGDAFFNALASYRRTWLNSLGAEWRTDAQVGRTSNLSTDFYQPLNAQGKFFVDPAASVGRRTEILYQGNNRIAVYDINTALVGFDVGTQFGQYGEFRVGILRGQIRPALDIGPTIYAPLVSRIAQGGFTARLTLDQMDSVRFPRSGWSSRFNVFDSTGELGADHTTSSGTARALPPIPLASTRSTFPSKSAANLAPTQLPSMIYFNGVDSCNNPATPPVSCWDRTCGFCRAMYYRRILQGTLLEGAYGGFSLEAGKVDEPLVPGNPDGDLCSASLFVAVDTPIGPMYSGLWPRGGRVGKFLFLSRKTVLIGAVPPNGVARVWT